MSGSASGLSRAIAVGANIAVLVGLVFVGLEVRNSRAAAQVQTADGIADGFLQLNLASISDSTVARIWMQGVTDPQSLSDMEAVRFSMYMRGVFNQYTRVYQMREAELLDEDDWAFYAREINGLIGTPGGQAYLDGNALPDGFMAAVAKFDGQPSGIDMTLGRDLSWSN